MAGGLFGRAKRTAQVLFCPALSPPMCFSNMRSLQNIRSLRILSPHTPVRGPNECPCAQQEVTGEEEPGEAPKAALGGLFGRAKRTAQVDPSLLPCLSHRRGSI